MPFCVAPVFVQLQRQPWPATQKHLFRAHHAQALSNHCGWVLKRKNFINQCPCFFNLVGEIFLTIIYSLSHCISCAGLTQRRSKMRADRRFHRKWGKLAQERRGQTGRSQLLGTGSDWDRAAGQRSGEQRKVLVEGDEEWGRTGESGPCQLLWSVCREAFVVAHFDFGSYRPFFKTLKLGMIDKGNILSRKCYWLHIQMSK